MAFPTVESVATSSNGGATTTHTVTLPTGIAADELLLMFLSVRRDSTNMSITSDPSGFTELATSGEPAYHATYIFAKKATGSEGASVTFTTDNAARSAHITYRISGWYADAVATDVAVSTVAEDSTASPDPGSLSPAWGAAQTLWLVYAGYYDPQTVSAYPSGFSNGQYQSGVSVAAATAENEYQGATLDPGAFTLAGSEVWDAWTIAVRPGGVSGVSVNIGDAGKAISQIKVNIGDAGKAVSRMAINIGDAGKDVFP